MIIFITLIFIIKRRPPRFTLFPYTTLFRSEIDPVFGVEKLGQPVQIEPPDRIREQLTGDDRPGLPEPEEANPWRARRVVWLAGLRRRRRRRRRRIAIQREPQGQPQKAERASHDERPAPSPGQGDPRDDER